MSSLETVEVDSDVSSLSSLPTAALLNSNAIGETLLHFWTKNLLTDVNFTVIYGQEEIIFSAHQLIVSMWSPVLADVLFKDPARKAEDAIKVTDASPTAFQAMLKFMYGSKAELHHQRKNTNFILNVYKIAAKYEVTALKTLCSEIIHNTPSIVENVFAVLGASAFILSDILEIVQSQTGQVLLYHNLCDNTTVKLQSILHCLENIQSQACQIILQNNLGEATTLMFKSILRCYEILSSQTGQVLSHHKVCDFTSDMMNTILSLHRVSLSSEYELAEYIFAWAKSKYACKNKDFKTILFKVMPYLRLTSLSAHEFGMILWKHANDWFDEKDGFNIFMNIVVPGSRPLPEWCRDSLKIKREYNYAG